MDGEPCFLVHFRKFKGKKYSNGKGLHENTSSSSTCIPRLVLCHRHGLAGADCQFLLQEAPGVSDAPNTNWLAAIISIFFLFSALCTLC
jgi:hypothetical protein